MWSTHWRAAATGDMSSPFKKHGQHNSCSGNTRLWVTSRGSWSGRALKVLHGQVIILLWHICRFDNQEAYQATALSLRDRLIESWNDTQQYFKCVGACPVAR